MRRPVPCCRCRRHGLRYASSTRGPLTVALEAGTSDAGASVETGDDAAAAVNVVPFSTTAIEAPQHLAIDGAGNLFVANFTGGLTKLGPDGAVLGRYGNGGAGASQRSVGIALDRDLQRRPSGSTLGVRGRRRPRPHREVRRRRRGGRPGREPSWAAALSAPPRSLSTTTAPTSGALGTFSQPYAIAKGNGRYYVADNGAGTVQALASDDSFAWVLASSSVAGGMQPTGVAVSRDGARCSCRTERGGGL